MSLKVDLAALQTLSESLGIVAAEFEGANATSETIADAVGHDGLAQCVRDFADKWDDAREGMTENLKALADTSKAVSGAFTDLDGEFAKSLEGDGG